MNYRHVYMLIIEHAKSEENLGIRAKGNGNYYERHHILPKSLFPNWKKRKSNLVLLTAREHFFCHQLLTKVYPCWQMWICLRYFLKETVNSKSYQRMIEEIQSHLKDYYASDTFKEQVRNRDLSYLTPSYKAYLSNRIKSARSTDESKLKTSKASKQMWVNKHDEIQRSIKDSYTDEVRKQMSEARKNYISTHYSEICDTNKMISKKVSKTMKLKWSNKDYRNNMLSVNNIKVAQDSNCKRIRCIQTNEIFESIKEARIKYGKNIHISDVLVGRRKYAGKLSDGTNLSWEYA